jgi:hypothetical protein
MKDSAAVAAVVAVVAAGAGVVAAVVAAAEGGADSAVVRLVADFPVAGGLLPDLQGEGEAAADAWRVAAPTADRRSVHPAEGAQAAVSPVAVVRAAALPVAVVRVACNPDRAREWDSETGRRLVRVGDPEPASCLPAGSAEAIDRESARVPESVRASDPGSVPARGRGSVRALRPARGQGRCRVSEPGPVWGLEQVSAAEIEARTWGHVKIAPPVCRIAWPTATA